VKVTFSENKEAEHEQGSCMPVCHGVCGQWAAEAVLCRGMGFRARTILVAAGIKPFLVEAETISEAIGKYNSRERSGA